MRKVDDEALLSSTNLSRVDQDSFTRFTNKSLSIQYFYDVLLVLLR
jgi:hypothetical protein